MARKKVERTLLVDHDIVIFRYASTCQYEAHWSSEVTSVILKYEEAKYGIDCFLEKLKTRCSCAHAKLCMTGDYNFRYGVLPSYKHNRVDKEKPLMLHDLKEWSRQEYDTLEAKGFEADDLMGIYGSKYPDTMVVATIDKDLKSIPCKLYLWNRDTLGKISLAVADYSFYYQILIGDSTDGYTGCPGVGSKAAEKLLLETRRKLWWPMILEQYEKALCKAEQGVDNPKLKDKTRERHCNTIDLYAEAGGVKEYAIQQARVARICRWEDHNPKTMEVKLWCPPVVH